MIQAKDADSVGHGGSRHGDGHIISSRMMKTYLYLTKPGIVWGNCVAATGGFMLAANGNPDGALYLLAMLGVGLIVASGCVFNNIIDTDIDSLMSRTQKRALVVGKISKKSAMIYAYALGIAGFSILFWFVNLSAFLMGLFGFYVYVIMYSVFYKRSSVHGTLIGSMSGATPPVIGYLAVVGEPNLASLLIFLGFCAWQMPHSYAIAIFRKHDYQASSIPLLPIVKGLKSAQMQMLVYTLLYLLTIILLFVYHYVSYVTLIAMSAICLHWLYQTIVLFKPNDESFDAQKWGKKLFISSIIAVTVFSFVISIDFLFR